MEDPVNHVMYYPKNGPDRAFVKEDTELPHSSFPKTQSCLPIMFRNGNIYPSWIDIANGSHEIFTSFRHNRAVVLSVS